MSKRIALAVRALAWPQERILIHSERFDAGTPDPVLFATVARKHKDAVFVTSDKKIRTRDVEIDGLLRAGMSYVNFLNLSKKRAFADCAVEVIQAWFKLDDMLAGEKDAGVWHVGAGPKIKRIEGVADAATRAAGKRPKK